MTAEVLKTKAELGFAGHYEETRGSLPGDEWVHGLRDDAWRRYAGTGLPHRRVESWKYTDLRGLLADAYPPAPILSEALSAEDVDAALGAEVAAIDCYALVMVDGRVRAELSDMEALAEVGEVHSLAEALEASPEWLKTTLGQINPQDEDPVIALNMALMSDGVALRINDGATLTKPIHIVHIHAGREPVGLTKRNVVRVGNGATLTLMESFVSRFDAPAQRNAVTEIDVGDSATVRHVKYQADNEATTHLGNWLVRLGEESDYKALQFSTGAAVARNQVFVAFAGEGATSHINGAVMLRGNRHNDTTMVVDHAVPGCESREFNKLVLDDDARGIVQCKVNVHKHAQKSDGHQMAQALMLSETAEFDSKPELEIFADDVVCGHGSTSGQVEEELMFYLRSRGIPEKPARALLIAAFVGEAIERLEDEAIRDAFQELAGQWLAAEDG